MKHVSLATLVAAFFAFTPLAHAAFITIPGVSATAGFHDLDNLSCYQDVDTGAMWATSFGYPCVMLFPIQLPVGTSIASATVDWRDEGGLLNNSHIQASFRMNDYKAPIPLLTLSSTPVLNTYDGQQGALPLPMVVFTTKKWATYWVRVEAYDSISVQAVTVTYQ